ncbi:MAG TPA: CpsB/CapC family capsule biosynthesis tyrosine phosphatase [Abditibacterium sp.]|jgi:protein-tyrosine phosphatase
MLDLHCHILPAIDDGPGTLEESLEMARLAREDGICDIIATPHHHFHLRLLRADILPRVAALNEELQRAEIDLQVWPGSEIQLVNVAAYRADYEAQVLCHLGDRPDFSLLEWPWNVNHHAAGEVEHVRWLRERGTRPIVAHPERHEFFRDDLPRLDALVEAGAWIQLTAGSFLGLHGADPQKAAPLMLARYREVVLATDSHNLRRRSGLSQAYNWIAEHFGAEREDEVKNRAASVLERLRTLEPR